MRRASQLAKIADSKPVAVSPVRYPPNHTSSPVNTNAVAKYSATYTITWILSRSGSLPGATPFNIADILAATDGLHPASTRQMNRRSIVRDFKRQILPAPYRPHPHFWPDSGL